MYWKTTALVVSLALVPPAAAAAQDAITPPAVPNTIAAPEGVTPFLRGHAIGTQNYICAPAATPSGYDWLFLGPQATVFDDGGEQILTHFLSRNPFRNETMQATWQHSRDTSITWATKQAGSLDSAYVAPGAIEWLLLEVTGGGVGPTGGDRLAGTRYIQRVNTEGGVKPAASDCRRSTVNTRQLVSYAADYYFYR